jgi:nucleoside-diphosphate-sugar epimerase
MDVSRMAALGWNATTTLRDGLNEAYDAFLDYSSKGAARL